MRRCAVLAALWLVAAAPGPLTIDASTVGRPGSDAVAYLRTLPNVRADRIGVIGFSHGGWTVMESVLAGTVAQDGGRPFAAAVAYYPACPPPRSPLVTDTLILIGDADDWTPSARCERWRDMVQSNGHTLLMTVYPGVLHSFDAARPTRVYVGHRLGYDPAAATDAFARTRQFLAERLQR